jgi:hypothetical protein
MESAKTAFRALCIFSHNVFPYDQADEPKTVTLQQMVDYLAGLAEYRVIPVTLQEAHAHFRRSLGRGEPIWETHVP